jgi:hypothetical protein
MYWCNSGKNFSPYLMKSKKVTLMPGYPPAREGQILYLFDINYFIVIPAKVGIQIYGIIRLFTRLSYLNYRFCAAGAPPEIFHIWSHVVRKIRIRPTLFPRLCSEEVAPAVEQAAWSCNRANYYQRDNFGLTGLSTMGGAASSRDKQPQHVAVAYSRLEAAPTS